MTKQDGNVEAGQEGAGVRDGARGSQKFPGICFSPGWLVFLWLFLH